MVLTPRFIAKSTAFAQASKSPTLPRPVAKAALSPRVLHSGTVPAQLCFNFKRS
jgi:hypothetical protein